MRKLFLVLAVAFLFQSCFSYRHEANPGNLVSGQKYKIERNQKTRKYFYAKTADNTLVVSKSRNGEEVQIPLDEITSIRKRKFSVVKTMALIPITAAVAVGIFALTYSGPQIGGGGIIAPN